MLIPCAHHPLWGRISNTIKETKRVCVRPVRESVSPLSVTLDFINHWWGAEKRLGLFERKSDGGRVRENIIAKNIYAKNIFRKIFSPKIFSPKIFLPKIFSNSKTIFSILLKRIFLRKKLAKIFYKKTHQKYFPKKYLCQIFF